MRSQHEHVDSLIIGFQNIPSKEKVSNNKIKLIIARIRNVDNGNFANILNCNSKVVIQLRNKY